MKVGFITDIHIGNEDFSKPDILVDVLEEFNDNADIVVILGDLTDSGTMQQFKEIKNCLKTLKIPYAPVIGNHDTMREAFFFKAQ